MRTTEHALQFTAPPHPLAAFASHRIVHHEGHQKHSITHTVPQSRSSFTRHRGPLLSAVPGQIVSKLAWGKASEMESIMRSVCANHAQPVCVCDNGATPDALSTVQTTVITGTPVSEVMLDGQHVGTRFEDDAATYCYLPCIVPLNPSASPGKQTQALFEHMENALHQADLLFHDIVRT